MISFSPRTISVHSPLTLTQLTWKVPGMHPVFLAEQEEVTLDLTAQSQTPSMHLEDGSAALHCKSVTHGSPRLTELWLSSTRVRIPVVVGVDTKETKSVTFRFIVSKGCPILVCFLGILVIFKTRLLGLCKPFLNKFVRKNTLLICSVFF